MTDKEIETFYPESSAHWRKWLEEHHAEKQSIWLICYRKDSGKPTLSWSEAVDQALCFGWIDSTRKTLDHEKFIQFFTRRKATSTWSKVNKAKVEQLIAEGLMTKAGMDSIELAKKNGSWNILDEVEELVIPDDLTKELKSKPNAEEFFLGLSKSVKKQLLHWIVMAKRPETRQKRIEEIAECASENLRPKQFRL